MYQLKSELKKRSISDTRMGISYQWHGRQVEANVCQYRVVRADPRNTEDLWAQITVRAVSEQKVDVLKNGKLAKESRWQKVTDHIVPQTPLCTLHNTHGRIGGHVSVAQGVLPSST